MRSLIALFVAATLATSALVINSPLHLESSAQDAAGQPAASALETAAAESTVSHGRYLVRHVAMCVQCHTPHLTDGALDEQQLLKGGVVPVKSPFPNQSWAVRAPPLAGLPGGWSEQQLAMFLQTGETPNGHPVRPPMPPFRLTKEDASSVAAYLRSLR